MVLFYGYIDLMGAYKIKRKIVELIIWLFWGLDKYFNNSHNISTIAMKRY
jgi:hypothetical protein